MTRDATRRRRWRGWLMAVLVAACVDGPTSPGQFGELRIRPSYSDGDAPTALGLSVDSAKVRVVRPGEPAAALVDTMVRYASDTASLGWVLTLRAEEEPLLVDVAIWDDDNRVYSGEREVVVRESDVAESGAEDVLVAYVGPAIVKSVTVSPASVTLEALHATAPFTAEARDRHEQVVATAFSWSSGNPHVATVDPATGAVTAVGNGTTTIQAVAGSANGSATVVVAQRVSSVAVTPESPTLTAIGATLTLQASVRDANGFAVAEADVTWASSNDGIVRVDAAGTLTAVAGGMATITASSGGIDGSTLVTVNPVANVASITVSPADTELSSLGATTQFTAVARDADGGVLSGVQFTWTSSATNVATISETGLATSTGHGSTTIFATAGSVSDAVALSVNLTQAIAQIVVTPGTATLSAVSSTLQFTAEARDARGAVVPGVTFAWSSTGESVATIAAATGLATAIGQGSTAIRAAAGNVEGSATLNVELTTSIASITVSPSTAALTTRGATHQFTAIARDGSGNELPGIVFEWTSSTPGVATVDASGLAMVAGHGSTSITAAANDVSGTATLSANLALTVTSIVVSPSNQALGSRAETAQFTAIARDENNAIVPGVPFTWSSSSEAVATIDPSTGLATATGHGSTTIVAAVGDVQDSATLTVDLAPTVARIVVTPATVTLTTLGATQQFVAEARDGNDAVIPGMTFAWTSSAEDVAMIDASNGFATVTGDGVTTITARVGTMAGTARLTAELRTTVVSIVVAPANASLGSRGATQQFTAVARDANNVVVPGVQFTWSSSTEVVATIDPSSGLATATGHGSATIVAVIGEVQGTAALAVDLTTTITSIVVSPATASLGVLGATQQFAAEARDAGGAVVTGIAFTWTSSAPAVATVDAESGLATVAGHGSATITATANEVSGAATLTADLTPHLARVVVTPSGVTLTSLGATQQFVAEGRDANNAVIPGMTFGWTSSSEDVAAIDASSGLATVTGNGATTITARAGSVSGTANLTADLRTTVTTIVVSPSNQSLGSRGATAQFTAVARDENNAIVPGVPFMWSSSSEAVATIDPSNGLATATGHGSATIVAAIDDVQGSATLTVDLAPSVVRIVITPATVTLTALGATQQFVAEARDGNDAVIPGMTFAWTSSEEQVAAVGPSTGLATVTGDGATTITASANGISATATLTAELEETIASITVTPANASLTSISATQQFTAVARDANNVIVPGVEFTWASSSEAVATVDPATGLAAARGHGATTIIASVGHVQGSASLSVELLRLVASIVVLPSPASVHALGVTQQFTAEARDVEGAIIPGIPFVWTTSVTEVATIDPATGLATAVGNGVTTVTASAADIIGTSQLTVQQVVVRVDVTPASITMVPVSFTQLTATAYDANDRPISGLTFSWSSSNKEVARVNATGLVEAMARGSATIEATVNGVAGRATVTVECTAAPAGMLASIVVC